MGARLYFVEQTDILDRNYRLVGECLDQLDLPVGERLWRAAHQKDDADWRTFAHQRNAERRPVAYYFLSVSEGMP